MRREELLRHVFDVERAIRWREEPEVIASALERLFLGEGDIFALKKGLVEKYGGDPRSLEKEPPYPVASLTPGLRGISIIARVATIREGRGGGYHYGILEDPTGQVRFVAWSYGRSLRKGGVYRFSNVDVRSYRGSLEVVLREGSSVRSAPAWALGEVGGAPKKRRIKELRPGERNVEVEGNVLAARTREAGGRIITEGVLEDETGIIAFRAWDTEVKKGYKIRAVGRVGSGPILIFDRSGLMTKGVSRTRALSIPEAVRAIGGYVEVLGRVVRVLESSGVAFRCPICGKTLTDGVCPEHGRVEGKPQARLVFVLDDGRDSILAFAEGEVAQGVLGEPLSRLLDILADAGREGLRMFVLEKLAGRRFLVGGRVRRGKGGPLISVEAMKEEPLDPEEAIREIT